ncbi:MAG: rRNA maturation RNase YbeY [Gammaproteobacteria bacterium]|nr:rRNA maturation RNase YbeY [Gammaproteobacteria bacterium]
MNLALEIQPEVESAALPTPARFERWAGEALADLGAGCELSIRIVGEDEGRELNRTYRQKDYPTNVLSFPADIDELPAAVREALESVPLGDLVICAPVVAREAGEQGKPLDAHWAHLVVHGCLHLLGHDHENDAEAEAMESLETAIMGRLGYPDPYLEEA